MLATELSETKPKVLLFILNRNGLEETDLRLVISKIADTQFGAPDVKVLWLSVFGKLPDRPHALITLNDDEIAKEMINQTISIRFMEIDCTFEISEAFGTDAKDGEDPHTIFLSNIPVKDDEEKIRSELSDFFASVARPSRIIFPRNWIETRTVLLNFDSIDCAKMVMKVGFISFFKDKLMRCSYAKKREPRQSPVDLNSRQKQIK